MNIVSQRFYPDNFIQRHLTLNKLITTKDGRQVYEVAGFRRPEAFTLASCQMRIEVSGLGVMILHL